MRSMSVCATCPCLCPCPLGTGEPARSPRRLRLVRIAEGVTVDLHVQPSPVPVSPRPEYLPPSRSALATTTTTPPRRYVAVSHSPDTVLVCDRVHVWPDRVCTCHIQLERHLLSVDVMALVMSQAETSILRAKQFGLGTCLCYYLLACGMRSMTK